MLKNENIDPPSDYPGAVLVKKKVDSVSLWTISAQKYFKAIIDNVVKGMSSKP